MWAPGAPYNWDPGRSTDIRNSVGPGGPVQQGPREVRNIRTYVGIGGPVQQGSREVNKYTQLWKAWGPRTTGIPGGQQIYAIMWGLGAPYNKDPGRSTNIRTYVGPGGPVQQGSREVNKYTHSCGVRGPRPVQQRPREVTSMAPNLIIYTAWWHPWPQTV
jgi:hypothetical protein